MRAVAPITPTSVSSAQRFQLHATRALPVIDCTVNVKHAVFSPRWLARFNAFTFAGRRLFGPAYGIGFVLCAATLFTPMPLGGWFAAISTPLQLAPMIVAFVVLRHDMVVLLTKTYEFWYMTLMNLFVSVGVSVSFGDARWPAVAATSVGFELALLIDANFRRTHAIVLGTAFGALLNMAYTVSTTFGYIHKPHEIKLIAYNNHALLLDDAILNILGTIFVLLLRNAYRKHVTSRGNPTAVVCVTYRCRLGIRPAVRSSGEIRKSRGDVFVNPAGTSSHPTSTAMSQPSAVVASRTLRAATVAQLAFVSDPLTLDPENVLLASAGTQRSRSYLLQRTLLVCSTVSLVSILTTALSTNHGLVQFASCVAVATALVVFLSYGAFAQRQLLRRLFTSFDFLFLSCQITITHACIADIVQWSDPRARATLASWLLTHWVLLLDAVLPTHKRSRLGFHPAVAGAVLVVFLAGQLLTVTALAVGDAATVRHWRLRDRELFTLRLHDREKQVRVVPLLFGRTLATLSWSLRLLWRLWDCRADELLLLQGRVEFRAFSGRGAAAVAE